MAFIDDLEAKVTALTTVNDSAVALITSLAQAALDAPTVEEKNAILTDIQAQADRLAAAVSANTPTP